MSAGTLTRKLNSGSGCPSGLGPAQKRTSFRYARSNLLPRENVFRVPSGRAGATAFWAQAIHRKRSPFFRFLGPDKAESFRKFTKISG